MKKSTKKSLTALVAVPVAAALLAGCGLGEVKSSIDENPYAMQARTYSTQTTISNDIAFAGGIKAPTLEYSDSAYVSSVSYNRDGSTVIVMENVNIDDYSAYRSWVGTEAASTSDDGDYDVFFADETADYSTMTIKYSTGVELEDPTSFRLMNLATDISENLYMKYIITASAMYNCIVDSYYEEMKEYYTRDDIVTMLASEGITEENFDSMAMEMAVRGEDFALGFYYGNMSSVATKVGDYMYVAQKGPECEIFGDTESEAIAQVWYKELYTEGAEDGITIGSLIDIEEIGGAAYEFAELLNTYSSTGYEMINGKVYYYEEYTLVDEEYPEDGPEFSSEEDEEVYEEKIRYYFNGNDLVYVNSSGFLMEILISSSIPERMFRTECPTGYLDYTGRVEY